jgi:small subunit ribosomal protein S16
MLTIRLARTGKRNTAQFKIMLQERTVAPGGRHVEILGSYNPHSKEVVLEKDRIKYWIEKGAFVSDTVHNLLVKNGVISEKKRVVKLPKKAVVAEAGVPKEEAIEKTEEAPAEVVANKVEEVVAPVAEEAVAPKVEPARSATHSVADGETIVEKKEEVVAEKKEDMPVEKVPEPKV